MRDKIWLDQRLQDISQMLFPELEKKNNVIIRFKGKWKNKFGHIKLLKNSDTEIAINSLFQHPLVPESIIDTTIAHELIHYMHGFNSPHKQQYKHPHAGGIVTREMKKRGFSHMLIKEKNFMKTWFKLYERIKQDL